MAELTFENYVSTARRCLVNWPMLPGLKAPKDVAFNFELNCAGHRGINAISRETLDATNGLTWSKNYVNGRNNNQATGIDSSDEQRRFVPTKRDQSRNNTKVFSDSFVHLGRISFIMHAVSLFLANFHIPRSLKNSD